MTKDSLQKLEQLINAAPLPTEPLPAEDGIQQQGDDPNTPLTGLTLGEFAELQSARGQALANQITSDEINRQRHLDDLRDIYIPKLFQLMIGWLGFVAICVVAVALHIFALNDPVVIALITTTTATVLGIFVIVAKWLFPAPFKEK